MKSDIEYVLMTDEYTYFVEYLLEHLVLSNSITEAMIFNDIKTAEKFKIMLKNNCYLKTTITTFID